MHVIERAFSVPEGYVSMAAGGGLGDEHDSEQKRRWQEKEAESSHS